MNKQFVPANIAARTKIDIYDCVIVGAGLEGLIGMI